MNTRALNHRDAAVARARGRGCRWHSPFLPYNFFGAEHDVDDEEHRRDAGIAAAMRWVALRRIHGPGRHQRTRGATSPKA